MPKISPETKQIVKALPTTLDVKMSRVDCAVATLETLIKKKQKKAPNGFAYIPVNDIQVAIDELR